MISGLFDVARAVPSPYQAAYYGEDQRTGPSSPRWEDWRRRRFAGFYSVSEFDPPDFQRQAAWLVEAYAARQGRWPRLLQLAGHNHQRTETVRSEPFVSLLQPHFPLPVVSGRGDGRHTDVRHHACSRS
jgi:hypothetical protein